MTKHVYSQAMVVPVKSDLSMEKKLIDIAKNKSLIVHHIIIFFFTFNGGMRCVNNLPNSAIP